MVKEQRNIIVLLTSLKYHQRVIKVNIASRNVSVVATRCFAVLAGEDQATSAGAALGGRRSCDRAKPHAFSYGSESNVILVMTKQEKKIAEVPTQLAAEGDCG